VIVDDQAQTVSGAKLVIIPANSWHEFKNRSDKPVHMINIYLVPKMITEWT
jgi:quercetin dioxygenase-like cupin family protein